MKLPNMTIDGRKNHRLVTYNHQIPGNDFDRIEDLAANATELARHAVDELALQSQEAVSPVRRSVKQLMQLVEQRRSLCNDFRETAHDIARHFEQCDAPDSASIARGLREAISLSHRVADLIAAERSISRLRGFPD